MKRVRPKKGFGVTMFFFYVSIRSLIITCVFGESSFLVAIAALIIAIVLLFTVGGFKAELQLPFEDSQRYRKCYMGTDYNLEQSLNREMENREQYYLEQNESRKTALQGFGIFMFGVLIDWISTIIDHLIPASLLPILPIGHIAACYVEYFGVVWIFQAYLNSRMAYAKEISEKFMQYTTSIKIEECSKMIALMQKKLREQENKKQQDT